MVKHIVHPFKSVMMQENSVNRGYSLIFVDNWKKHFLYNESLSLLFLKYYEFIS